jgi:biotin carboxyl carrier protein
MIHGSALRLAGRTAAQKAGMQRVMFDQTELERLAELVRNANISELTLKLEGRGRITIRKGASTAYSPSMGALVPIPDGSLEPVYNGNGASQAEEVTFEGELPVEEAESEETVWITAPLVGRFHRVKPLIGLGARVTRGQIVGTIDAVGIVHEVLADVEGVIIDVLIEDETPVEYGQPLFLIKLDSE